MDALFGSTLLTKDGEVETSSLDVDVVGIYFSAHWCPPCRGFTPQLAKFYEAHAKTKSFEIVFASSDQDEKSFKEYFAEMPWKSIPYSDRKLKEKLSKKFKVSGIPTLVFVDAKTGKLITTEGREGVSKGIENFPYKPRTWADFVESNDKVVTKAGDVITFKDAMAGGKKYAVFYFSASWCGPCRSFTPDLAKWYEANKSEEMEIFFVSADKGESEFKQYHNSMPFPAMQFDGVAKDDLMSLFGVGGYPTLVVADAATGNVVCGDARGRVASEPESFPWAEKAVEPLGSSLGLINENALAILLVDKAENDAPEKVVSAFEAFTEVAEETFGGAGGAGEEAKDAAVCADGDVEDEDEPIKFAVGKSGDEQVSRIREFFGLDGEADKSGSIRLFVSHIPTGKKFVWSGDVPNADDIRNLIKNVKKGEGAMDLRKAPAAA